MPRITNDDYKTIATAINYAIEDREGFLEAYSGCKDEEALKQIALTTATIARLEALHVKLFNRPSMAAEERAHIATVERRSIFEI